MRRLVRDFLMLVGHIYRDAVAKCTDVELDLRDLETIRSRVEDEGLSFLTITLPTFGKDFDMSLAGASIDPTLFRSFKKSGRAPAFLQGFLDHVFDRVSGRILDEPCIQAIEGIRQICYAFKKVELDCTPKRQRAAVQKFIEDELVFNEPIDTHDIQMFEGVAKALWGAVLYPGDFNPHDVVPKHGPGATAEGVTSNRKFSLPSWYMRLEPHFPILSYGFFSSEAHLSRELRQTRMLPPDQELPVKVTLVPKTLKTPRIIAIEPTCMQYAQQAVAGWLVATLESHELTAGHINFSDQSVNRDLAMSSSHDGKFATLDLSSASDRVPFSLAISMFNQVPVLKDAIKACRSTRARLPKQFAGEMPPLKLRKFASMGSALCFPIEAMYFYTICVVALLRARNLPTTLPNIFTVSRDVYVYEDDILVPTDESGVVIEALQKYYCKVNVRKSFNTGHFRESCGMDAYDGEEVTPLYVRRCMPYDKRNAKEIISCVESSNAFYKKGYWTTAKCLQRKAEEVLGKLPVLPDRSPGLGLFSFQGTYPIDAPYERQGPERVNTALHRYEVKAWVPTPVFRRDPIEGEAALAKCLLLLSARDPGEVEVNYGSRYHQQCQKVAAGDVWHLTRTARHGAVTLKRQWVSSEY